MSLTFYFNEYIVVHNITSLFISKEVTFKSIVLLFFMSIGRATLFYHNRVSRMCEIIGVSCEKYKKVVLHYYTLIIKVS